jgi:hypothetical protein
MGLKGCTLIISTSWLDCLMLYAFPRLLLHGLLFMKRIIHQLTLEIHEGCGIIYCVIFCRDKGRLQGLHFTYWYWVWWANVCGGWCSVRDTARRRAHHHDGLDDRCRYLSMARLDHHRHVCRWWTDHESGCWMLCHRGRGGKIQKIDHAEVGCPLLKWGVSFRHAIKKLFISFLTVGSMAWERVKLRTQNPRMKKFTHMGFPPSFGPWTK